MNERERTSLYSKARNVVWIIHDNYIDTSRRPVRRMFASETWRTWFSRSPSGNKIIAANNRVSDRNYSKLK